ncbi:Nucleolar complex protein 2 [Zea mays]|uniref:Nucleolar complex protein 2 n=1 Tax=Zea mays TaxID=4577 RepID=A0A3L6EQZ4_MAIZE|nr:Nucleolar complex protein 2 [Zea mays]
MLNELSTCSQMFYPIPSLLFDCLELREVSQKEQTQRTKINFSSLLKVPKNLLKSRDFQEECILSAIQILSAHFAQWSYHVSFPEVATIPLVLLKRLHEQTTVESLRHPIKCLIDQVPKNLLKSRDFQEECILSAIQILSAHFAQWSYHVSFPEVATIPLVLLKRLHEQTTVESLRHPIKCLIDQVTKNKDFIERKKRGCILFTK